MYIASSSEIQLGYLVRELVQSDIEKLNFNQIQFVKYIISVLESKNDNWRYEYDYVFYLKFLNIEDDKLVYEVSYEKNGKILKEICESKKLKDRYFECAAIQKVLGRHFRFTNMDMLNKILFIFEDPYNDIVDLINSEDFLEANKKYLDQIIEDFAGDIGYIHIIGDAGFITKFTKDYTIEDLLC
jgi:hypothetical protein